MTGNKEILENIRFSEGKNKEIILANKEKLKSNLNAASNGKKVPHLWYNHWTEEKKREKYYKGHHILPK